MLREGFRAASARTGEIVRDFRVAGTSVRLRFAGEALMPMIIPGLAYPVRGAAAQVQCEICLWDSESTGVPLAPPPRPWRDFSGRGNIWGFDSARYRSAYQWGEGSVNVMDCETRQAVYWVPSHQISARLGPGLRRFAAFSTGGWNSTAVNWCTQRRWGMAAAES